MDLTPVRPNPDALPRLLARAPARTRWAVALAQPGEHLRRGAGILRALAAVPGLQAAAGGLRVWLDGLARDLGQDAARAGLDPEGGFLVGQLDRDGQPGGWFAVALAHQPGRLLMALQRWTGGRPLRGGDLAVPLGATEARCTAGSTDVVCASDPETLAVVRAAAGPGSGLASRFPGSLGAADLASADGLALRLGPPDEVTLIARWTLTPWGLSARLHASGEPVASLAAALDAPAAVPASPGPVLIHVAARLSAVGRSGLLRVLIERATGATWPAPAGAAPAGGEVHGVAVPTGWWATVPAGAGTAGSAAAAPALLHRDPRGEVWALPAADRTVLASSAALAQVGAAAAAPAGPLDLLPAVESLRRRGPASLWVEATGVDPLELLGAAGRARLLAAQLALPPLEAAAMDLVRAAAQQVGTLAIAVRPVGAGLRAEAVLVSPGRGVDRIRAAVDQAWTRKWSLGGFYEERALADLRGLAAGHPAGRAAGLILAARRQSGWDALADLAGPWLDRLRGPEVSCAALSARLGQCAGALGRLEDPERWARLDDALLPELLTEEREDLLARARAGGQALVTRCDRLRGRLEPVEAVNQCLGQRTCRGFVRCLDHVLRGRS